MAYLPLILLIAAAFASGAAVLLFIIYLRANREKRTTIFPVVRETEALKATWARLGFILFAIVAALSTGGWFATQQNLILRNLAPTQVDGGVPDTAREAVLAGILASTPTVVEATTPIVEETATLVAVTFDISTLLPPTETATVVPPPPTAIATHTPPPTATPLPSPTTVSPTATTLPTETPTRLPTATQVVPTATLPPPQADPTATVILPTVEPPTNITETIALVSRLLPLGTPTATPVSSGLLRLTESNQTSSISTTTVITAAAIKTLPPLPDNVTLGPIVFSTEITPRRVAVAPKQQFNANTEQIYAVFPYQGMQNGLAFTIIWYFQDKELTRENLEWSWGNADLSYTFIKPVGLGQYRVEMQVNQQTMASASFEVTP